MAATFFTTEAGAETPHFCIIGKNSDSFFTDAGQKTGIEYSLSVHLRENGYLCSSTWKNSTEKTGESGKERTNSQQSFSVNGKNNHKKLWRKNK